MEFYLIDTSALVVGCSGVGQCWNSHWQLVVIHMTVGDIARSIALQFQLATC